MLKNIASTYLARLVGLFAYVVLLPVIVSHVGSEKYGVYAMTVAFAILFNQDLGMGNAATRAIAIADARGDQVGVRQYTSTAGILYAVVATVASLVSAVGFFFLRSNFDASPQLVADLKILSGLAVLGIGIALVSSGVRQVLIGLGYLDVVNVAACFLAATRVLATIAVLHLGGGVVSVAVVDTVVALFGWVVLIAVRTIKRPGLSFSPKFVQRSTLRDLFGASIALLVVSLAGSAIVQGGSVIAGITLGPIAVAVYAVAQRLFLTVKEVTGSLAVVALPAASRVEGRGDVASLGRAFLHGTALANSLLVCVAVPVLCFIHTWLGLWVGSDFDQAATPAVILIVSLVVNGNHLLATPILTARGRMAAFAVLHAAWAVLGLAGAYALASIFDSTTGVALGLVLPLLILEPLYVRVALRELDIGWLLFVRDAVMRPLCVGSIGVGVLLFIGFILEPHATWSFVIVGVWFAVAPWLFYRALATDSKAILTALGGGAVARFR